MKKISVALFLNALFCLMFVISASSEIVYLKDGSAIKGVIIESTETNITLKAKFGEMVINKSDVERVEFEDTEVMKPGEAVPAAVQPIQQNVTGVPQPISATGFLGSLLVDSFPSKGDVYLNKELVGRTPFTKRNIEAGVYKLTVATQDLNVYEDHVEVPIGRMEKVYLKMDKDESIRLENPGYAYESKIGFQIRALEENMGYLTGGVVLYFPYFRLSGDVAILSPIYTYSTYGYGSNSLSVPFKVEGLVNIPFDWFAFQVGVSYSHYQYSFSYWGDYSYGVSCDVIGFPIGFEFFANHNLSFDFHFGPALVRYGYIGSLFYGSGAAAMGAGFCCDVGGMNIYF